MTYLEEYTQEMDRLDAVLSEAASRRAAHKNTGVLNRTGFVMSFDSEGRVVFEKIGGQLFILPMEDAIAVARWILEGKTE